MTAVCTQGGWHWGKGEERRGENHSSHTAAALSAHIQSLELHGWVLAV